MLSTNRQAVLSMPSSHIDTVINYNMGQFVSMLAQHESESISLPHSTFVEYDTGQDSIYICL